MSTPLYIPIVQALSRIAFEYKRGDKVDDIAARLNADGYRTITGVLICGSTISKYATYPVEQGYCGLPNRNGKKTPKVTKPVVQDASNSKLIELQQFLASNLSPETKLKLVSALL